MKHRLKGEMASRRVWLDGKELKPGPSQKIWNHSPDGFTWGYGGSGPAQLALAICFKVTRDRDFAVKLHQEFKRRILCALMQDDFEICLDWDLSQPWLFRILPVAALQEAPKAPVIERNAQNPERSEHRPGTLHCIGCEADCDRCPWIV